MLNKLRKYIDDNSLLKRGDSILVGLSGGPDSVALLHLLLELRHFYGLKISAVHINHGLRKSADTDEYFVKNMCSGLQIPLNIARLKMAKAQQKGSIEELARKKRLQHFARLAKRKKISALALGHHQDDLAETVLMRLIRGTGLLGMQAILPKRKLNGLLIIRPLLQTSREQINAYLRVNKIKSRQDPTNRQTHFLRNKIRHKLIPLLEKEYKTNITAVLSRLAQTAAIDYEHLNKEGLRQLERISLNQGKKGTTLAAVKLKRLSASLRRIVIRLAIKRTKGDLRRITTQHIEKIENLCLIAGPDITLNLPDGITVARTSTKLLLRKKKRLN